MMNDPPAARVVTALLVAQLACSGVRRESRTQPATAPVGPATQLVETTDASRQALDVSSSGAPADTSVSSSTPDTPPDTPPPDALPRCADLDPTPASCAASHPGRAFRRCRWTVGPVYACGRGSPPPSARALVCICNGCRAASDCPAGSACTSLGYPCGPLASVCMNSGLWGNLDEGAYHDDHGHLRLGAREDYAGRTPALRAPCAP